MLQRDMVTVQIAQEVHTMEEGATFSVIDILTQVSFKRNSESR